MLMQRLLVKLSLLSLTCTAAPLAAGEETASCKDDFKTLCGEMSFNKKNIMKCFADKKDKLSKNCKDSFDKMIGKSDNSKPSAMDTKKAELQDKAKKQKEKLKGKMDSLGL